MSMKRTLQKLESIDIPNSHKEYLVILTGPKGRL